MRLVKKNQFKRPHSFDELLKDDPFGLLENVGEKKLSMSADDKIDAAFEEIAEFVKSQQRLPSVEADDFEEKLLATKYQALLKKDPKGQAYCESFLENSQAKEKARIEQQVKEMEHKVYENIDDVFNDDPLGLLSDVGDKPVEHEDWRKPDKLQSSSSDGTVAKATVCQDFYRYQHYFDAINRLLDQKHLEGKAIVGDSAEINLGDIFVIDGMMSIITEADKDKARYDASKSKLRYRVKQIFANGTESKPFSASIKASFYKSSPPSMRIVYTDHVGLEFLEQMHQELAKAEQGSENAIMTGYIYILGSKSTHPEIRKFTESSNLIKIGYCTTDVATRIANAEHDPTYLCAPVTVLKTYRCFDFDPKNLEDVLHTILASHRLDIELKDSAGQSYKPREWFTVSVKTASDLMDHLFAGDLNHYYIDNIQGKLKRK